MIVLTVVCAGCIGATDRDDFDAEVRARGGGISNEWVVDAMEAIAAEVAAPSGDDVQVLSMAVDPSSRTVAATVRRADRPEFVDSVVVVDGEVRSVSAVQDADELPLDDLTVAAGALPLDDVEALSDRALAEFGETDGYVEGLTVIVDPGGAIIRVEVGSERQTGEVLFGADGTFVSVES